MEDKTLNILTQLNIDWDVHLRIGLTRENNWFVMLEKVLLEDSEETFIAMAESPSLTEALEKLLVAQNKR